MVKIQVTLTSVGDDEVLDRFVVTSTIAGATFATLGNDVRSTIEHFHETEDEFMPRGESDRAFDGHPCGTDVEEMRVAKFDAGRDPADTWAVSVAATEWLIADSADETALPKLLDVLLEQGVLNPEECKVAFIKQYAIEPENAVIQVTYGDDTYDFISINAATGAVTQHSDSNPSLI